MNKKEWESLCRNCGLCCHEKGFHQGFLYIRTDRTCPFLSADKLCTVYDERLKRCKDCRKLGFFNAVFTSYLPSICGYVVKYRPWRIPKERLFF